MAGDGGGDGGGTYEEAVDAPVPGADARHEHDPEHLMVIVEIDALVGDGEAEGDGRVRLSHGDVCRREGHAVSLRYTPEESEMYRTRGV